MTVQVTSSAVLWLGDASAVCPSRRRYLSTKTIITTTINTKKKTEIARMKLKSQSTLWATVETWGGIQKLPSAGSGASAVRAKSRCAK